MHEEIDVAIDLVEVDIHIITKQGNLEERKLTEVAEDLLMQDRGLETLENAYFELLEWGYSIQGERLPGGDRTLPLYRVANYWVVPVGLSEDSDLIFSQSS